MRRILVVDDDRHVRFAIAAWLKGCGFDSAAANGFSEPTETSRSNAERANTG